MAPRPTLPALVLLAALLACAAAPSAARTLLEDAAPKPGSGLAALSNALQKAAKAQRAAAAGAAPAGTAATPAAVTTATPRQGADAGVGVDPSEITFSLEFNPKLSLDPSLGLTPLSLAPAGTLSVNPLALTLERALAASGVLSPRAALSNEGTFKLPGTSLTVEGGDKTVKAPSSTVTVEPKAAAAGGPSSLPLPPLLQLLSNLRNSAAALP